MNVLVFRNRFGPVAVWVFPADGTQDYPDAAYLTIPGVPRDPRLQNMASKGSGQTWEQWAGYLASQPLLGNWAVQELPGTQDADVALNAIRRADTSQAAVGS